MMRDELLQTPYEMLALATRKTARDKAAHEVSDAGWTSLAETYLMEHPQRSIADAYEATRESEDTVAQRTIQRAQAWFDGHTTLVDGVVLLDETAGSMVAKPQYHYAKEAQTAREHPNTWVVVTSSPNAHRARSIVSSIRLGKLKAFGEGFESAKQFDGAQYLVLARFVGVEE